MTLFTTLLVLIVERLFKLGEHWQLDHRVEAFFRRVKHFSMMRTVGMTLIAMGVTFLLLRALHGLLFNVPLLVAWILIGLLCIGAGKARLHYHAYLNAAARDDAHAREAMASELTLIHGVPPDCDEREFLRELQNALLWNNFRFYLAPLFWLIVGGPWGPVTLVGYAFLRAWQSWLARYQTPHQRLQSGIDAILHVLVWIPVRLAGVVYALIGVIAARTGLALQSYLQNPWVLGGLAWVFVVLAGGMFGWFDMQLPSRWQTAVATHSNRWSGGRIGSAFVMGAVAAVVVGPCVAPPLAGALLYIGQTGDAWLGGWALFALAWGMGTPLLLLGASATFLLPKVGAWMNQVRQGFGVLLLANAWWLLNPLLSVSVQMLGWGVLLLGIAVWLRALDALPVRATALQRLSKGVGVLALVLALAQLSGALAGSRDPWQPLAVFRAAQATTASTWSLRRRRCPVCPGRAPGGFRPPGA